MLPGFRFLFAAIILSMSVLVFGLGAAALLRAAHEQFASIPSRRATARTGVRPAERTADADAGPAALRAAGGREGTGHCAGNAAAVASAETETPAAPVFDATPAEPEKLAALKSEETVAAEPAKPEIPAAEPAPVTPGRTAETAAPQPMTR